LSVESPPLSSGIHERLSGGFDFVAVRTQVPTINRNQIDLELRFGSDRTRSTEDVLLWVEVKHAADPHENQLDNYLRDIQAEPGTGQVVLLAPRASLERFVGIPSGVTRRAWQRAGHVIWEHARLNNHEPATSLLCKELYRYMTEQHLTEPPSTRPEHFVAMAYMGDALEILRGVCERASARVRARLGEPTEFLPAPRRPGTPDFGMDYWESWSIDGHEHVWMDWNAYDSPPFETADGRSVAFVSGLCADDAPSLEAVLDPERRRLLEDGVEVNGRRVRFVRVADDHERFAQVASPESVLVGRDLAEQADTLADWITSGLEAVSMPLEQLRRLAN